MFTWVTLLTTDTDYQIINSLHGSLGFFLYIISHVLYKAFIHLCGNFLALWSWFEQTFKEVFKYHRLTFLVKKFLRRFYKTCILSSEYKWSPIGRTYWYVPWFEFVGTLHQKIFCAKDGGNWISGSEGVKCETMSITTDKGCFFFIRKVNLFHAGKLSIYVQ